MNIISNSDTFDFCSVIFAPTTRLWFGLSLLKRYKIPDSRIGLKGRGQVDISTCFPQEHTGQSGLGENSPSASVYPN